MQTTVICADREGGLQGLTGMCIKEGDKRGLLFSKEKLGIRAFNGITWEPIKVLGIELEKVNKYKILGV